MEYIVHRSVDKTNFICHHGVKGQKWGIRNGPPYPLDYDVSDLPTIYLPVKEWAHVIHEINSNITPTQRYSHKLIVKCIDKYIYYVENNFDGTFRIVKKIKNNGAE